jgi:hypothetical protein
MTRVAHRCAAMESKRIFQGDISAEQSIELFEFV